MLVANNILAHMHESALQHFGGKSALYSNLCWNVSTPAVGIETIASGSRGALVEGDPKLDEAFKPLAEELCVDAGAKPSSNDEASTPLPSEYRGKAPDLGAVEIR